MPGMSLDYHMKNFLNSLRNAVKEALCLMVSATPIHTFMLGSSTVTFTFTFFPWIHSGLDVESISLILNPQAVDIASS